MLETNRNASCASTMRSTHRSSAPATRPMRASCVWDAARRVCTVEVGRHAGRHRRRSRDLGQEIPRHPSFRAVVLAHHDGDLSWHGQGGCPGRASPDRWPDLAGVYAGQTHADRRHPSRMVGGEPCSAGAPGRQVHDLCEQVQKVAGGRPHHAQGQEDLTSKQRLAPDISDIIRRESQVLEKVRGRDPLKEYCSVTLTESYL